MRLLDLNELAASYSDSEKGLRYVVCFYTDRDRRILGIKHKMSVVRWVGRKEGTIVGYFDSAKDVRAFFASLHKEA